MKTECHLFRELFLFLVTSIISKNFLYDADAGDEGRCAAVSLLSSVEEGSEGNFMKHSMIQLVLK